jgi:Protein of unknown function (DUF3225)
MHNMIINIPEVVAELRLAFDEYETALMANDVPALINKFWQSEMSVRFGATENLYGWNAIVNFRQNRLSPAQRSLFNTVITSFGQDYANVTTEFRNAEKTGRQSQSWIRTELGWRIAAAHVSYL